MQATFSLPYFELPQTGYLVCAHYVQNMIYIILHHVQFIDTKAKKCIKLKCYTS